MRTVGAAVILACVLAGVLEPAYAQEGCAPGDNKLGVARTITIDTVKGPSFGAQYKSRPLLADGEFVLTFDDGPSRTHTRAILDALAAQCTRATFFMVGQMAIADPQMVREVARRGHTVATHTWSHANLQALPEGKAQDEIELGFSAVQQALGKPIAPFFRFPYLRDSAFTLGHLRGRQIANFAIDIDSRDFETRDAPSVYNRVLTGVGTKRKGIILFHDIHGSTARALPRILEEMQAHGFRVVHLTPKAGVETLADYDALARRVADRRRLATARNPLADRAVVPPAGLLSAEAAKPVPSPARRARPDEEDWTINIWRRMQ